MPKPTPEETISRLRAHLNGLGKPPEPKFRTGEAVVLDNGCYGIVAGTDPLEDCTFVYYMDETGEIRGPSFGWELERLEV